MTKRKLVFISAVLILASCSGTTNSDTAKKAEPKKEATLPTEPVTGKTAFWVMYKPAYQWAADMQPLKLESGTLEGVKNADGKAAVWKGTFASAKLREARVWTYAIDSKDTSVQKGLSVSKAIPWRGPTHEILPFHASDLATDSDGAYQSAVELAGKWLKQHPGKDWEMLLGNSSRFSAPVWRVLWGDTKSGFFAFVDSRTGKVLKK